MVDYKKIGIRLKQARKKAKLTQAQVAEQLGVTDDYVSRIETASVETNIDRFAQLSTILNIPLEYLLCGVIVETPEYINQELTEILKNQTPEKVIGILNIIKIAAKL